jgi:hypothetical protein
MPVNIDNNSDKIDSMNDFIPLFKFDSRNIQGVEHTMFVNKNRIYAFSHLKLNEKDCLLVKFERHIYPTEYLICKEENPTAYNTLFKGLPEKLKKDNSYPNSYPNS